MPKISPAFAERIGRKITDVTAGGPSAGSLRNINVVAEKAGRLGGGGGVAASTVGTICTADCISTASCVCLADDLTTLAQRDPELMKAVALLHDRAIRELGEDGLAEAMANLGK
jgi:hypothetical protein